MIRNKKVLVTGADGFIGSHLVQALVKNGAKVRALSYYNSFNKRSPAKITQWEIIPKKSRFSIKADYRFEANGKVWEGSSLLSTLFLNEAAAFEELKKMAKEAWLVWHQENDPQVSMLEKSFPWNLCFRFVLCVSVLFYFLIFKFRFYNKLLNS